MSGRLLHYSYRPIETLRPCCYIQITEVKPAGLWVSVEGDRDWPTFWRGVIEEAADLERIAFPHVVTLREDANILRLSTEREILAFGEEFGRSLFPDMPVLREAGAIDWRCVSEKWQGIIIAPYCRSLRFDLRAHWYYIWDCASGCIWDLEAVCSIQVEAR